MSTQHGLIVGASNDIAEAIAVDLASLGYDLSLWGRQQERLDATARAVVDAGGQALVDLVDVTDLTQLASAARIVAERGPLGVVVWAAGVFDWNLADQADPDTVRTVLTVNLTSAAAFAPMILPHLIQAAPSALILLGSGAAHQAFAYNAAYVASKHGLAGLARALFLDVRDRDVKVSLISPGLVSSGGGLLSPAGQSHPERLLAPADVAAAVRFVVTSPANCCPTEIRLQPQRTPG